MMKIVRTQIKSNDNKTSYESKAIYHNNSLKYKEDDVTVVLEIYDDYLILRRHNKEFNYTFIFKKDDSKLEYVLNTHNYKFNLDLKTNKLVIEKDKILVNYVLDGIDYTYEVIIEEDL